MSSLHDIGERLRNARRSRQLSLDAVAKQIGVSVATLSRIETNKQGMDLPLFIQLARALGIDPAAVIGENGDGDGDGLVRQLAALPADQRARIMIAASRGATPNGKRADLRVHLDGLLSTLDLLRDELLELQRAVRKND